MQSVSPCLIGGCAPLNETAAVFVEVCWRITGKSASEASWLLLLLRLLCFKDFFWEICTRYLGTVLVVYFQIICFDSVKQNVAVKFFL